MARTWIEEEIKNLVQTNDKVLYGALKQLYACQTADEQCDGATHEQNGMGFNGVDAPILSSFCEFLEKTGFLTPKQREIARKKLVKYTKQLTKLANAEKAAPQLTLNQIMNESIWIAKMTYGRHTGTYEEMRRYSEDEECREIDLCAKQPDHLQKFFDDMWAWEQSPEGRWLTIPEYYDEIYINKNHS